MSSIKTDVEAYRRTIELARAGIEDCQSRCSHPVEARESKNSRCNSEWDATAQYSTDHHCTICDKRWSED